MQITKTLFGFIIVLTISFIGFQVFDQGEIAIVLRSLLLPMLTVLYYLRQRDKSSYFFYFLLTYSASEFMGVFTYFAYTSTVVNYIIYYGGNTLYIIAYVLLIIEVLKSMDLKRIFIRFPLPIIILLAFDVYSVILLSETSFNSGSLIGTIDFFIDIVYNISIMFLLTVTFINYISRHSKKAMNLLVGTICIVFSEVIQVAYFYVSEQNILNVIYSILLILAFGFFYIQSKMIYVKEKSYEPLEELKA